MGVNENEREQTIEDKVTIENSEQRRIFCILCNDK
jgi:hypothetical protein